MPGSDIVDRLKAAANQGRKLDPEEVQALLIEASDEIVHLRRLLDPTIEGDLDLIEPKGRA